MEWRISHCSILVITRKLTCQHTSHCAKTHMAVPSVLCIEPPHATDSHPAHICIHIHKYLQIVSTDIYGMTETVFDRGRTPAGWDNRYYDEMVNKPWDRETRTVNGVVHHRPPRLYIGHRRRHVHRAGTDVPVLRMTAWARAFRRC